jgi:hypothetical protein
MSNSLTVTKTFMPAPTTFEEAWRMSQVLADSDMVPKDFKGKPANCMIAMQWGADLGIPGIQALQNIAVINGRPSIWGDAAKALIIGRNDCEDIHEFFEGEGEKLTAVCTVKRKGKSPTTAKFSIEDARNAVLLEKAGPWKQYRNRMLMMRARSFALRDAFPDALRGLSIAEESQDIAPEREINPIHADSPSNDNASPILGLDALLTKIGSMSIEDFKTIDPEPYSTEERARIRKAMSVRKKEILAQQQANVVAEVVAERVIDENPDWPSRIKECGSVDTLNALLNEMPEAVQIELGDMIDEQFDFIRSTPF